MFAKKRGTRFIAFVSAFILLTASFLPAAHAAPAGETEEDSSAGGVIFADGVILTDLTGGSGQGQAAPATLAAAATPVSAAPAPDFSDLSASYADLTQEEKAEILNRLGLLRGDPERGLMLDIKVRRSDAAVFFTRLLGREQYVVERKDTDFATSRFPDAPQGKWYTPYISYCTSIGLIAGRTDGYYYPDDSISEKEFANVLLKILGYEYQVDYFWDTVYEFSYDIGLFEDPLYAVRKEDNREYFRRDVCDQVFAVLGLEKKDSPKLLIEELVEIGAISHKAADDLGFDLSGLDHPGGAYDVLDASVDADIYDIYHLEANLLWVVFTKPVTFRDDAIEICQTYDYSQALAASVVEKTARDMLIRTGEQTADMDYTLDIGNVLEASGANAGMLSFDFVGYDPRAKTDTPSGLTSRKRDINNLPGPGSQSGAGTANTSNTGSPSGGGAQPGGTQPSGTQSGGTQSGGAPSGGASAGADSAAPSGASGAQAAPRPSGNADPSVDYFRIINAYTTASNEIELYFSQPLTETALNASLYNIIQNNAILSSGAAGQIRAALAENANNGVRLTASGVTFARGAQYRVSVSGRLTSGYTARLNEGAEDSYVFTAENVAVRNDDFSLTSISATTQYGVELEFSHPVNADQARQTNNYIVFDQNNRRMDVTSANVIPDGSSAGGGGKAVRVTFSQPLLTQQNCTLTLVFAQNAQMTASISNQSYLFQYAGQSSPQKSSLALTGALSNDPSSAELYFSQKLDPVSACIASNYTVNGLFDGRSYIVNPIKISYDPVLTPYMVRLYFQSDRRFVKDQPYAVKVANTIRDDKKLNPDRPLELQFFANNRDPVAPALKNALIVGDGIVRLDFSKEIMFDPARISEGNFMLVEAGAPAASGDIWSGDSVVFPILAKYVNSTTVILRFDSLDMNRKYAVRFSSITDFSGQYTTAYPDQGSSAALRNGKR